MGSRSQSAFTLIEVLVSVVILVVVGTAVALTLESTQQGALQNAEYNQAAGLATTIAEDIKDNYTDNTTSFDIYIPNNALGGSSLGSVAIAVPLPGETVGPSPLIGGTTYSISCAYPAVVPANNTTGNTTASSDQYNAVYTISVTDKELETFRVTVLAHGVLGG